MLETVSSVLLIAAGVVLALFIAVYAGYVTLFPLARTLLGGLQVLREHAEQRATASERDYVLIPDPQLGLTMADGGDRVDDEEKRPEGDQ